MCQIFCIYLIFQSLFGSLFARMICANFVFFNLLIFLEVLQSFYLLSLAFLRGQIFANLAIFTFFNLLIFCGRLFAGANLSTFTFFNLLIFCGWLFARANFCKVRRRRPASTCWPSLTWKTHFCLLLFFHTSDEDGDDGDVDGGDVKRMKGKCNCQMFLNIVKCL